MNEKNDGFLDEYTRPRSSTPKFWLWLILLAVLAGMAVLFKVTVLDTAVNERELAASLELFDISSRWVVKEKIADDDFKGIVVVPQITFRARNRGAKALRSLFFLGVFRFLDDNKAIGEGYLLTAQKPLPPGGESQPIQLTSTFGYRGQSLQSFDEYRRDWKGAYVEIYIKSGSSMPAFIKSYYISRKIAGMDIDVKIAH